MEAKSAAYVHANSFQQMMVGSLSKLFSSQGISGDDHLLTILVTDVITKACLILILIYLLMTLVFRKSKKHRKFPPGPRGLPIVGSLFSMGSLPHQTLAKLEKEYGGDGIMLMHLGSLPVAVITTARMAMELHKISDAQFASRPYETIFRTAGKYVSFEYSGLGFTDYTPRFRSLRKIVVGELFAKKQLDASAGFRSEEVAKLVASIHEKSREAQQPGLGLGPVAINMRGMLYTLIMDNMSTLLFGQQFGGSDKTVTGIMEGSQELFTQINELIARFYIGDLIPFLRPLDPQGYEAEWKKMKPDMDRLMDLVLEEHKKKSAAEGRDNNSKPDLTDVMLALQEDHNHLNDLTIKALLMDMLIGGISPAAATLEWMLLELTRHPAIQQRLVDELESVVGNERSVQGSDIAHLPYLQAIAKESLRLHAVLTLGFPQVNEEEATIAGFTIPKKTTIFVNIWSICRDPEMWANPLQFDPERFVGTNLNVIGNDYHLIPFGAGRRMCPGMPLALRSIQCTIVSLVHAFKWAPPPGKQPEDMCIEETMGIVCYPTNPLAVTVTPRLLAFEAYLGKHFKICSILSLIMDRRKIK